MRARIFLACALLPLYVACGQGITQPQLSASAPGTVSAPTATTFKPLADQWATPKRVVVAPPTFTPIPIMREPTPPADQYLQLGFGQTATFVDTVDGAYLWVHFVHYERWPAPADSWEAKVEYDRTGIIKGDNSRWVHCPEFGPAPRGCELASFDVTYLNSSGKLESLPFSMIRIEDDELKLWYPSKRLKIVSVE